MTIPTLPKSRDELKAYCLKALGHPLMKINVTADQIEDRINECIQVFWERHQDGTERVFLPHAITASVMHLSAPFSGEFQKGDKVVGQTSGAQATMASAAVAGVQTLSVREVQGTFVVNEAVAGPSGSAHTATTGTVVVLGDVDTRSITLPDEIMYIYRLLPISSSYLGMFDIRYQILLHDLQTFGNVDLVHYTMTMNHLSLINELLASSPQIRFSRYLNKLSIDFDWKTFANPGDFMVLECFRTVDPEVNPRVYGSTFVREYTTALIQRQWGANLSKFSGIQLAGGVALNGDKIQDEANAKIEKLHERLDNEWSANVYGIYTG